MVEMAVVLTIVALLVGGILVGKNMIRASEVQATVANVEVYRGAVNAFTERYLELPGDFQSASTYWTGAYDGDGNGMIGGGLNTSCGGTWEEQWAAFEHMSRAELVEGYYTHTTTSTPVPGSNTPETPISGGGYTLRFCGDMTASAWYFTGQYGHVLQVGGRLGDDEATIVLGGTRGPLFTPEEAGSIDQKMDDGFPGTGRIRAPRSDDEFATGCTTTTNPATADYNFAMSVRLCPLFFLMGF